MLDWLIVGGGIHGTHLALVLTARGGVDPERLRILDPHETLLARWERCTASGSSGRRVCTLPGRWPSWSLGRWRATSRARATPPSGLLRRATADAAVSRSCSSCPFAPFVIQRARALRQWRVANGIL